MMFNVPAFPRWDMFSRSLKGFQIRKFQAGVFCFSRNVQAEMEASSKGNASKLLRLTPPQRNLRQRWWLKFHPFENILCDLQNGWTSHLPPQNQGEILTKKKETTPPIPGGEDPQATGRWCRHLNRGGWNLRNKKNCWRIEFVTWKKPSELNQPTIFLKGNGGHLSNQTSLRCFPKIASFWP